MCEATAQHPVLRNPRLRPDVNDAKSCKHSADLSMRRVQRTWATAERNRGKPVTHLIHRRGIDMKLNALNSLWIAALAGLALAGCNQSESPADTRADVASAQADAQRDVADAQADAQEQMADAQRDAADATTDNDADAAADAAQEASETGAEGEYKVAVAQAEASHKIAVEKCDALTGNAQDDCKERADADLENAKQQAERRRDGTG